MGLKPLLNSFNFFVFHVDAVWEHHIATEPNLVLMKPTFLQQIASNLSYGYNVTISIIISVDKNVVQIYNDEDVKLFSKDFVDQFLEACRCVR